MNLEEMAEAVVDAVKRFKTSAEWQKENGQYIPRPERWLNEESWEAPAETLGQFEFGKDFPRRAPDAMDLAIALGTNGDAL